MVERDISGVPVIENGAVAGIVTKSDLMRSTLIGKLTTLVKDTMEDIITVSRYHSLDHVIDLMRERNDRVVVVNNDGTLAGIITESNLAFYLYVTDNAETPHRDVKILRKGEPAGKKLLRYVFEVSVIAEDLMSRPVVTIAPDATLGAAVSIMRDKHINSIVVVENKEIKGIVKRDDVIKDVAQ
jgi:CBS domain-containing protein